MNNSSGKVRRSQVKSFTSLFDIFAPKPFQDVYHLYTQKEKNGQTISKALCNNNNNRNLNKNESILFKVTPYVTTEQYHALNKKTSDKSIVRSTSTLFYDLDKLIKRHSYHCISQIRLLKNNVNMNEKFNKSCFSGKSETIVQKCSTQIQPKLRTINNLQIKVKKSRKNRLSYPKLSSEIRLNDNDIENYTASHYGKNENNHQQKFWSYAKYQTELTNSIQKEKKCKKKDRGKRIEDPCPCQLFSYACPCTDKKSLTELAKNSKCLTVADQITSTTKFTPDEVKENKNNSSKVFNCDISRNTELKNTDNREVTKKSGVTSVSVETVAQIVNARLIPKRTEDSSIIINGNNVKLKSLRKSKQIFCPKCGEKLENVSIIGEDNYMKSKNSPFSQNIEFKENFNNKEDNDVCTHNPPCELVPVCQILPNDNYNSKYVENVSTINHNPKIIRITKACRHHPPCTVVPSCQRVNVLKNNCEYIPPCLHRPRCVNLPLCVPFFKKFYYDDILNKQIEDIDITDYRSSAPQEDSANNPTDHQFHSIQNTCEYFNEYSPKFVLNPKMTCMSPTLSPYFPNPISCKCCMTSKSCQYDCVDCKCISYNDAIEKASVDAVVYIRDVGCQFRNRSFSPQDSLLYSKTSSASFNFNSIKKTGKYYGKFHTLRYEDKYTNPISGEELSMSTFTTSSFEIDIHCPSHGRQTNRGCTDFNPTSTTSPFVAAFTTYTNQLLSYCTSISEEINKESNKSNKISHLTTHPSKFRRSSLNGKRKKLFASKRQKKSRLDSKARNERQSSS